MTMWQVQPTNDCGTITVSDSSSWPGSAYVYGYWPDTRVRIEEEKKEEKMRGLFEVFIVDPEGPSIEVELRTVAESEEIAKMKVVKASQLKKELGDYDIIARRIGDVRAKKDIQEVRIAK